MRQKTETITIILTGKKSYKKLNSNWRTERQRWENGSLTGMIFTGSSYCPEGFVKKWKRLELIRA